MRRWKGRRREELPQAVLDRNAVRGIMDDTSERIEVPMSLFAWLRRSAEPKPVPSAVRAEEAVPAEEPPPVTEPTPEPAPEPEAAAEPPPPPPAAPPNDDRLVNLAA